MHLAGRAWDTAKRPTRHRAVPYSEELLAQSANGAEAENPVYKLSPILGTQINPALSPFPRR